MHQHYLDIGDNDKLSMLERIQMALNKEQQTTISNDGSDSHQKGENTPFEYSVPIIQQLKVPLLSEKTQSLKRNPNQRLPSWTGLMFSSNTFSDLSENTTAKAFNDVTQYRKRKRRVTQKLTLLGAMKEFKQETFPTVELPDLEIYLLSLITHRVSPRIPKRKKWAKIKDLMKTTLYQFNRKRLQTFLSHTQFAFLLLKFLETPDILSTLSKRSQLIKDEKCRETLVHHINLLKEECSNKLSNKSNNFLA